MNFVVLGQMHVQGQGWLTTKLLQVTLSSAEWVLWLLAALSVLSIAFMLERFWYFSTHRLKDSAELAGWIAQGRLDDARARAASGKGMEARALLDGIDAAEKGPEAVEEILAASVAREKPKYERHLSFLGTLGNNAPFVGLFGTVLGIIKAFHDLGQVNLKGATIQQTVMSGISEALVATAVGLAVAIPAVVSFNGFNRWLKTLNSRTQVLSHALVGHLRSKERSSNGPRNLRALGEDASVRVS
jgi:biopolymer transport protein ExbB